MRDLTTAEISLASGGGWWDSFVSWMGGGGTEEEAPPNSYNHYSFGSYTVLDASPDGSVLYGRDYNIYSGQYEYRYFLDQDHNGTWETAATAIPSGAGYMVDSNNNGVFTDAFIPN